MQIIISSFAFVALTASVSFAQPSLVKQFDHCGTDTSYSFSLDGFTAALKAAKTCGSP